MSYITKIENCRTANSAEGKIIVHTNDTFPHAVFRLRISGPEVHLVPIRYHSGRLHCGEYHISHPGKYFIELIMLYAHFDESNIRKNVFVMGNETIASPLPFVVAPNDVEKAGKATGTSGFWRVNNDSLVGLIRKTRTWAQDSWPAGDPLIYDILPITNATGLQFVSDRGPIFPQTLSNRSTGCLKKAKVCMWGDSQMRHLYNTITSATTGQHPSSKKQVLGGGGLLKYFKKRYDNFEQDLDNLIRFQECRLIIANFGHWAAGPLGGYPWSFDKYQIYVEADMVYLKSLETKYGFLKILWVTTNPHGYTDWMLKGTEWRTDPVLARYRDITLSLAAKHHIDVFDAFSVASPLCDLTYDGGHYNGVVGWTLAGHVLQHICK
jgi:hypothetical protein